MINYKVQVTLVYYWKRGSKLEDNGGGQCPHDPLTIYEATAGGNQNHVAYVPGTLVVHEWAAYSTFVPHSDGKHLLGIEAKDVQGFLDKLEKGIIMQD